VPFFLISLLQSTYVKLAEGGCQQEGISSMTTVPRRKRYEVNFWMGCLRPRNKLVRSKPETSHQEAQRRG
jgi:hypothetical protein